MSKRNLEPAAGLPDREAAQSAAGNVANQPYTAEQRAADAKRWAEADCEDEEAGWEDTRRRIATAFSTR
jgi:hypothetical protein